MSDATERSRLQHEARDYFDGRVEPLTQQEVEQFFGVSRFTILRWRREKGLRCFLSGNVLRFPVEEVYRFFVSQIV